MTSCFSLPWFLVVVFAIIAILAALMCFGEYTEKEYYRDGLYREVDDRIFLNDYLFEENKLLYKELMEYKRIASEYRCLNAKELEQLLKQLCAKKAEDDK